MIVHAKNHKLLAVGFLSLAFKNFLYDCFFSEGLVLQYIIGLSRATEAQTPREESLSKYCKICSCEKLQFFKQMGL